MSLPMIFYCLTRDNYLRDFRMSANCISNIEIINQPVIILMKCYYGFFDYSYTSSNKIIFLQGVHSVLQLFNGFGLLLVNILVGNKIGHISLSNKCDIKMHDSLSGLLYRKSKWGLCCIPSRENK